MPVYTLDLTSGLQSLHYLLSDPLQETFADTCSSGLSAVLEGLLLSYEGEGSLTKFTQYSFSQQVLMGASSVLCARPYVYNWWTKPLSLPLGSLKSCFGLLEIHECVSIGGCVKVTSDSFGVLNVSACQWVTLAGVRLPRSTLLRSFGRCIRKADQVSTTRPAGEKPTQESQPGEGCSVLLVWAGGQRVSQKQYQWMKKKNSIGVKLPVLRAL